MAPNWDAIREAVIAFVNPFRRRRKTNELKTLIQELDSLCAPGEMPRRIAICREALTLIDRNDRPELWAVLELNLGNSLQENPQGDRAQNMEEAISRYEIALEVRTREDFPVQWAITQNNLAVAYGDRIRGDRAQNIEEAISRYELALVHLGLNNSSIQAVSGLPS